MKLKHLESALSSIQREFPAPKLELEQYPTSPHLAAWVGLACLERRDIGPHRSCLDLGCGTGMLGLSAALLETDFVMAVDCDEEALKIAQENCEELELTNVEFVLARIKSPNKPSPQSQSQRSKGGGRGRGKGGNNKNNNNKKKASQNQQYQHAAPVVTNPLVEDENDNEEDNGLPFLVPNCVDTVVTNPPFGTKHNAGMDVQFLRAALRLARRAVYSFHKTSTRPYLIKLLTSWGLDVQVVAEMKFDIPAMYKFHTQKSVDVHVDLLRVGLPGGQDEDGNDNDNENDSHSKQEENDDEQDDEECKDDDEAEE